MAKKWAEVESSPSYQNLNTDEQSQAKEEYFNTVVLPKVTPEEAPIAKQEFLGSTVPTSTAQQPQQSYTPEQQKVVDTMQNPALQWGIRYLKDMPFDIGKRIVSAGTGKSLEETTRMMDSLPEGKGLLNAIMSGIGSFQAKAPLYLPLTAVAGPVGGMAAGSGLEAIGRGENVGGIAGSVGGGAATGLLMAATGGLGAAAGTKMLGPTAGKYIGSALGMGGLNAGSAAMQGANPSEITAQGLLGGAMGAVSPSEPTNFSRIGGGVKNMLTGRVPADQQLKWEAQDINKNVKDTSQLFSKVNKETQAQLKNNIQKDSVALDQTSQKQAQYVQDKTPSLFKENSKMYSENLDAITKKLVDNSLAGKETFTMGDAHAIMQKTVSDLDSSFITEGTARNIINKLAAKYDIYSDTNLNNNPLKPVNFTEFVTDMQKAKQAISSEAKSGSDFQQKDIPIASLRRNFGDYVATKVPEFAQLQKQYSPVMEMMKAAGVAFKPYGGQYKNLNTGAAMLKRVALGKATPQEIALVNALEQGTGFSKGLGDVTSGVKKIGQSLLSNKQQKDTTRVAHEQFQQNLKEVSQPKLDKIMAKLRQEQIKKYKNDKINTLKKVAAGALLGGALGSVGFKVAKTLLSHAD